MSCQIIFLQFLLIYMDIIELCAVSIFNIGKYRHANMTYFLWECGLGVKDVESGAINLKLVLLNYYIPKWRIVIPRNYIDTNGNILLLFQEEKRLDTEDTANSSSARSDRWVDFPFLIHVVVKCRCLGVEEILFMSEIFIFFMVKDVFGRFILSQFPYKFIQSVFSVIVSYPIHAQGTLLHFWLWINFYVVVIKWL